jgi:hypothetical protein
MSSKLADIEQFPRDTRLRDPCDIPTAPPQRGFWSPPWHQLWLPRRQSSSGLACQYHFDRVCYCTAPHGCHEARLELLVHGVLGTGLVSIQHQRHGHCRYADHI